MMFIRIGDRIVRTTNLRIDSCRTVKEDDEILETAADRYARVEQVRREIQEELKHQKPNKFGLI